MKSNVFDTTAGLDTELQPSPVSVWIKSMITNLRKGASDRALRRQLAELDDALLRDIGIADDEIARVRAQQSFMPRAWN